MKKLLKRFVSDSVEVPSTAEEGVALGDLSGAEKERPRLHAALETHRCASEFGEPLVVLRSPEREESVALTVSQYEVISRLDGKTSLAEATAEVLALGQLPVNLQGTLARLAEAGMLEGFDEGWRRLLSREITLEEIEHGAEKMVRVFWGRPVRLPSSAVLLRVLAPLSRLLSRPGISEASIGAGLVGFYALAKMGASGKLQFLADGDRAAEGFLLILFGMVVFLNLSRLLAAASFRALPNSRGDPVSNWRVYAGVPVLGLEKRVPRWLSTLEGSRRQLCGAATVGLFGAVTALLTATFRESDAVWWTSKIAVAACAVAYLEMSPWWRSPLRNAAEHALRGIRLPWDCWVFVWKRFIPCLFGRRPSTRVETTLVLVSAYLLAWTMLGVRIITLLLRRETVLMLRDGLVAESAATSALLLVLTTAFAAFLTVIVSFVAVILLARAASYVGGFAFWRRGPMMILTGIAVASPAFFLKGEYIDVFRFLAGGALVTMAVWSGLVLFRRESRSFLTPGITAASVWLIYLYGGMVYRLFVPQATASSPMPGGHGAGLLLSSAILIGMGRWLAPKGRTVPFGVVLPVCALGLLPEVFPASPVIARVVPSIVASLFLLVVTVGMVGGVSRMFLGVWTLAMVMLSVAGVLSHAILAQHGDEAVLQAGTPLRGVAGLELLSMSLMVIALVHYRSVLARKIASPRPTFAEEPRGDRELSIRGASFLWHTIQRHLAVLVGERAADLATGSSMPGTRLVAAERDTLKVVGESATDIVALGDELARIFERATPVWLTFVGSGAILGAAEAAYQGLSWRERLLLAEYAFRGEDIWATLTPKPRDWKQVDPERSLRQLPLFQDLPDDEFRLVVSRVHLEQFKAGQDIVVEGEAGDRMYVIESGTVEVLAKDVTGGLRPKIRLRAGDYFGQVAVLRDCVRTATVRAISDVWLFSLSRDDVHAVWPETQRQIHSEDFSLKVNRLHDVPLLRRLPLPDLEFFAERSVFHSFEAGEAIITEGKPGDDFYVIDRGEVRVTQKGRELRTLGPGEYFGEIALLFKTPRTATVSSISQCRCLVLPGNDFRRLIARQDPFRTALLQVGEARLAGA